MRMVFKKTLKISLCFTLSALMTVSSIAAGSALDGAEENELKVITPTEAETQGETVAETQEETQTTTVTETQSETQTDVSVEGEYILGDVNSDSSVNLLDAIAIQKFSLSMVDFTDIQKQCGDVDRNEAVNLLDSIMIQKFALGMLSDDSEIGKYFTPLTPTEPTQPTVLPTQQTDPPTQPTDPPTTPSEPPTQPTDPTEPDTVELNKTALTIGVGEKYTLIKSSPTGTDLSDAVFTSNNPEVVKVDAATGEVTGLKVGGATVRITTRNGATASCSVAVMKAPTTMSLNKTSLTLGVGETYDLNSSLGTGEGAYYIAYSSNASEIASVKSSGGIVTANKTGTATVTATAYNGVSDSCVVTVKAAPEKMTLSSTSLSLEIGNTCDLDSKLPSGQGAYHISYSSDNPNVASVKSAGGLVTAVSSGTATVTATAYNGVKAVCKVKVANGSVPISEDNVADRLHKGSVSLSELFGFDYNTYINWLDNHDADSSKPSYYIGTQYIGADCRVPNGAKGSVWGHYDYSWRSGMNCTGFVWHVLYSACTSGKGDDPKTIADGYFGGAHNNGKCQYYSPTGVALPTMGGSDGTRWYNTYSSFGVSRYYFASKKEMLNSGLLEKGDIIWQFCNNTYTGKSAENLSSNLHHIGIYYGDGKSDVFWHSGPDGSYMRNAITKIVGCVPDKDIGVYVVLKVR